MAALQLMIAGGGATYLLTGGSYSDSDTGPSSVSVAIQLVNTGVANVIRLVGSDDPIPGEWQTPVDAGLAAGYEARVTLVSGTLSTGTDAVWQALSSTRSWSVARATVGSKACTFTLEIRRASDGVVVASASYTLTASIS